VLTVSIKILNNYIKADHAISIKSRSMLPRKRRSPNLDTWTNRSLDLWLRAVELIVVTKVNSLLPKAKGLNLSNRLKAPKSLDCLSSVNFPNLSDIRRAATKRSLDANSMLNCSSTSFKKNSLTTPRVLQLKLSNLSKNNLLRKT
jgi:hypothetical protein